MTPDDVVARAKEGGSARSLPTRATKTNSEGQDTRAPGRKPPRLSQERRLEVAAARRQRLAEGNAALAARRKPTGFHSGTWVRTHSPRCRPFDNRIGIVVTNNLGEVGVGFGSDWSIQLPGVDAWFLPSELERVR